MFWNASTTSLGPLVGVVRPTLSPHPQAAARQALADILAEASRP